MSLTEICIRKPVLAWMMMTATIVFGGVAFSRIGISQFPDVDFPTINVKVDWEGAAPEVIEHDVVEPLEEAVVQVEGIRSITSTSRQGSANITIELDLKRNVDAALQDVQTRVAQVQRLLPRDIDPPVVSKNNPEDQPILWVGVSGPYPQAMISDVARYQIKEKLQTVPGVGEIMLGGYLERNIRIWIDAQKLDAHHVTVADVIGALRAGHIELPAGYLQTEGREVSVRVLGEALDLQTLRKIVLREVAGAPVYLSDVALVEDGFEDQRRLARVDGQPAQGLGIKKLRGSNAVEVARGVKAELVRLQKTVPKDMEVGVNFDNTRFIEESVHDIQLELLLAVLLTALVCWMFLGSLSSTLNVVLAIPMSLLGTVAVIYFLGFTLNTFTLLGLSLAVGIVVDDSIMVMENIFRHGEMGKDRVTAAREGTQEITFAALAATAAVIAIFIPVIFMDGVVGRFFLQFGITLCLAVSFSYLEAVTLAPARAAQILNTSRHDRGALGKQVDRAFHFLERLYARILARGLRRPGVVLLGALVILGAAIAAFRALPSEFVPSQDQSRLLVRLQTAVGSSLDETNQLFKRAEEVVSKRPEVLRNYTVIGGFGGAGVNGGVMFLTLKPAKQRMSQAAFSQVLRKEIGAIPGIKASVQDLSQSGFTAQRGYPVEFSVRGTDWETLISEADALKGRLVATGQVVDLDTDYQLGMPELRIVPNRQRASDLGVSIEDLASTLNTLIGGQRIGKYSTGGRRLDVRARLLAAQRSSPEDVGRLKLRTPSGELVPLSTLVSQEERPALQAITRRDRERAITFFANVAPGYSQETAIATVEGLGGELKQGYRVVLGGASVAFRDSFGGLVFALIMGILVAYMVLASQFNSFLHPVTVLTILPLSIAGAAFALLGSGSTLNIFSMIGLLLLMGIVKKNSIILVDYTNHLRREEGLGTLEALLKAGPVRLRPILMTSVATMMAAVPAALALGQGGEIRRPMAISVIGGLVISTALSLLVVPAFYLLADRAKVRLARAFARAPAPPVVETP